MHGFGKFASVPKGKKQKKTSHTFQASGKKYLDCFENDEQQKKSKQKHNNIAVMWNVEAFNLCTAFCIVDFYFVL